MKTTQAIVATLIIATFAAAGPGAALAANSWSKADEGTLSVSRLVFSRGVQDRLPVEPDFAPTADGRRLYAYLELFNKGESRELTLTWSRAGKPFHTVTLKVGRSPHWRTWAYLTLSKSMTGPWAVEVRTESGELLLAMPLLISKTAQ